MLSPLQVRDFKIKALISKLHTDRHPPTAKTNLRMQELIQTSGINHSFLQIVHDGDGDEGGGVLRPSGAAQGWLGTSRGAGRLSVTVRASCTLVLGTAAASLPDTGLTETNACSVPIKHPPPPPQCALIHLNSQQRPKAEPKPMFPQRGPTAKSDCLFFPSGSRPWLRRPSSALQIITS